jgi:hypothetical protein
MKILKLFLLVIILIGCNKPHRKRDVISIFHETGNQRGVIIISDKFSKIDSAYQSGGPQKSKIEYFGMYERFVVSTEALKYLMEYVDEHCHTVDEKTRNVMAAFIMTTYSLNDIHNCFYYDKSENIEYFTGMINWINNSNYKLEFKEVLIHLKLYVANVGKWKRETMYE